MALQFWDPWPEVRRLRQELDRVFDGGARLGSREEVEFPPIQVTRQADRVVIEALAPGIDRETLDITATGDKLTIRGERRSEPNVPPEKYLRREREVGRFVRTVKLNERLGGDGTTATYRDGILHIEVPYEPEAKPRKVPVA